MFKKRMCFTAAVVAIACIGILLFCACSPTSISVTISKDNMGVEIADTMYGLFLEDISFAGDGGLVSELVNNGSFEYEGYPTAYWNIDCDGAKIETTDNGIKAEVLDEQTLQVKTVETKQQYLRMTVNGAASIENLGFVEFYDTLTQNYNQEKMATADMGFHKDVEYDLSFYVRLNGFEKSGKISAKLNSPSNAQSVNVDFSQAKDGEWTKVTAVLKSNATEDGSLVIEFEGNGSVDIDFVSLIPHDTHGYGSDEWKYVTLREDLYQALENLSPAFIRFPGGCLAEGDSFEHLFDWKNTIGALEQREQYLNIWRDDENGKYYNNTFALGYHEYFQLCEDLGAKPLPILNVGMICQFEMGYNAAYKRYTSGKMSQEEWEAYLDTVALRPGTAEFEAYTQDIFDLIEYANATEGYWAKLREYNGHKEPFNIEYLGLGNENWGELYWRNFDVLYNAVKEYCAERGYDITIISSASYQFSGEYIDSSWEVINEKYTDTLVDEHYYTSQNKLFKYNDRYDNYERTGATVFVGEYAASAWGIGEYWTQNNMWSAIEEASYMTALERNGDLVKMASYAPTFAKINAQCWKINMIWFDSQDIVLTPNYFNQMLFANNTGSRYIETDISGKGVYSSTSIDEDEQVIYVKIVNANTKGIDISLDFDGFGALNASSMQFMSGVRAACNELGVTTVIPYQQDCDINGSNVSVKINGESINIIRVYYGDNDGSNAYNLPELPANMQNEVTEYTKFFVVPELAVVYGSCALVVLIAVGVGVTVWLVKKRKKKKNNEA